MKRDRTMRTNPMVPCSRRNFRVLISSVTSLQLAHHWLPDYPRRSNGRNLKNFFPSLVWLPTIHSFRFRGRKSKRCIAQVENILVQFPNLRSKESPCSCTILAHAQYAITWICVSSLWHWWLYPTVPLIIAIKPALIFLLIAGWWKQFHFL